MSGMSARQIFARHALANKIRAWGAVPLGVHLHGRGLVGGTPSKRDFNRRHAKT
jgi:hypothetical protein